MLVKDSHQVNDKRRYSRLTLPLQVNINSKEHNDDHLSNISEGGVCFQSTHSFEDNDFIFFHFLGDKKSSLENIKFSILGRIVWHDDDTDGAINRYGAQFTFYNDPFSKQQRDTMLSLINRYVSRN